MKHAIFLKFEVNLHTSLKLHFQFEDYKIFSYLVSFADFHFAEFMFAFGSFAHTKHFHCFVLQQTKEIKGFKCLSQISRTHWQCVEPSLGFI